MPKNLIDKIYLCDGIRYYFYIFRQRSKGKKFRYREAHIYLQDMSPSQQ